MNILLHVHACKRGQCLPLLPVAATDTDFCRSHGLMQKKQQNAARNTS